MLIFDKAYTEIRKKYIVKLKDFYIQYRQLRNNNIKVALLEKTQNVKRGSADKEFIFYFSEEDLFKALLGDIFLFYIRSLLQKNDFQNIKTDLRISPNWNITTHYYSSYFDASLLLRLCYRGNIFLDDTYKKSLERIVSSHLGDVISLDSNLFYYIEEQQGIYVLRLTKSEKNTHEVVWQKIRELLDEMTILATKKSEEELFLLSCREILTKIGNTFPSKLRNKVNYQPQYGLDAVDKKLYPISASEINWVREILSFDEKNSKTDDNHLVNAYVAYATYIEKLTKRLVQDYFEMSDRENHILAAVNRKRKKEFEIVDEDIPFSY